jgi:uncharacterized protein (TIGR02145 family)
MHNRYNENQLSKLYKKQVMKKLLFVTTVLLLSAAALLSQEKLMRVYQNGNVVTSAIDSVKFDNIVVDADPGVVINGVKWATRNVEAPGTFAATPENAGMFYQWNRRTAWPSTGSVTDWDNSTPSGTEWEAANDPSPAGWRVPTRAELESLLNTTYVTSEWTTQNGVTGRKFTDKATGASIFLPAAGFRGRNYGVLSNAGAYGNYWSSAQYYSGSAYYLYFDSDDTYTYYYGRSIGYSLRCVAAK